MLYLNEYRAGEYPLQVPIMCYIELGILGPWKHKNDPLQI